MFLKEITNICYLSQQYCHDVNLMTFQLVFNCSDYHVFVRSQGSIRIYVLYIDVTLYIDKFVINLTGCLATLRYVLQHALEFHIPTITLEVLQNCSLHQAVLSLHLLIIRVASKRFFVHLKVLFYQIQKRPSQPSSYLQFVLVMELVCCYGSFT